MSQGNLRSCSADIICGITALISGNDLARLYLTGDSALLRLIRSSPIQFALSLPNYGHNSWPLLLHEFTHLYSVNIGQIASNSLPTGPYLPSVSVSLLPKSLRELKLHFANGFLSLFQPLSYAAFATPQDPEPLELDVLFPNLRLLHVSNAYRGTPVAMKSSKLFNVLGRLPLIDLSLEPFILSDSDLSSLPATLERISLTSDTPVQKTLENPIAWPPGLTSLKLTSIENYDLIQSIPKSLSEISVQLAVASQPGEGLKWLKVLPLDLRHLTLKHLDHFGGPESLELPPKLETLDLKVATMDVQAVQLPSTLIHFNAAYGWPFPIFADGTTFPPFPSNLKTYMTLTEVPDGVIQQLPVSIESYRLPYFNHVTNIILPILPPSLTSYQMCDPSARALRCLPGANLHTFKMSVYGPSPVASSSQMQLSSEHFDVLSQTTPNLRHLIIHSQLVARDLAHLTLPLESLEVANCYELEHLWDTEDLTVGRKTDKKSKKAKKEQQTFQEIAVASPSSSPSLTPPTSTLWYRNLQSLVIWSPMCASIRMKDQAAWMKKAPRTLKKMRFFHPLDPMPLPFDGRAMMEHLPPQLEELAGMFFPFPEPEAFLRLPQTLRTLHLGGTSQDAKITVEHLESLPRSLSSVMFPFKAVYPSQEEMDDWARDRFELVEFVIYSNYNFDVPPPRFNVMSKIAPATSFQAAVEQDFERKVKQLSSPSSSNKKEKKDKKDKKEKKDKEEKTKKKGWFW